ncbi:conserved hypothetical protein [Candidatus Sulfopaludibacter sp. SbA3]|nr:conserved hypothetical protein [Candidatus Sulfopaludibacter sp. SbA3]
MDYPGGRHHRPQPRWVGWDTHRLGALTLAGNGPQAADVHKGVTLRISAVVGILTTCTLGAVPGDYASAQLKFALIEAGHLRPGARIVLSLNELTAYAEHDVPDGVRNPRLRVTAPGVATGTAMVDFGKVRRAQGYQPGWLLSRLLDGERPVSVTARIQSGGGKATVSVERVEVGGLEIDGKALDFLIQNFLIPMYPEAAVGRPFELGHRIEKLDVQPSAVGVLIGK